MMKPNTRQCHKFTGCNENISSAHLITRRRQDFPFCVWQSTPANDIFLWHMMMIFMMIIKKTYSERRTDESVESKQVKQPNHVGHKESSRARIVSVKSPVWILAHPRCIKSSLTKQQLITKYYLKQTKSHFYTKSWTVSRNVKIETVFWI